MTNKDEVDVLFGIRNAFYTGNYQSCITEAQKIKKVLVPYVNCWWVLNGIQLVLFANITLVVTKCHSSCRKGCIHV